MNPAHETALEMGDPLAAIQEYAHALHLMACGIDNEDSTAIMRLAVHIKEHAAELHKQRGAIIDLLSKQNGGAA